MVKVKILGLEVQIVVRKEWDRLRDDRWMVNGSGGWKVDSRSPTKEKLKRRWGKIQQRVICKANGDDVGDQKKEENRGFPMNQQSRGLVKKQVRYEENKK